MGRSILKSALVVLLASVANAGCAAARIAEVGSSAANWEAALSHLEERDIVYASGGGEDFPTNRAADVRTFVANGGAFVVSGIAAKEQLAALSTLFTNGVELVFRADDKDDRKKPGRLEVRSNLFTWPRYAKECAGSYGGIETRGRDPWRIREAAWLRGRCVARTYRLGRGFFLLTTASLDWGRLRGNVEKALELQRFGLAYEGAYFTPGGSNDRCPEPRFGEGFFQVPLRNVTAEKFKAQAVLDIATAAGTRRYWANDEGRPNDGFTIRIRGLFDLHGPAKASLKIVNRATGAEIAIGERQFDFPPYLDIEPPFYRESISTARRESDVRLALVASAFAEDLSGRVADVALFSPEGKELAKARAVFSGANRVEFKLPLDRDAPAGIYTVKASLPKADGVATAVRTFKVVGVKKHQVFVDQDGTLLRDGKPWFPIGFFHVWPEEIEDVATTGADFIQFWDSHSTLGPTGTLARIAAKGMKVVVEDGIWGMVVNTQPNRPEFYPFETAPAFRAREEALRDDPSGAIAMWYVADEPGVDCLPGMHRSNRHRREMDPDHPTFVCSTGDPAVGREGDILGLDIYPRYNNWKGPLTMVSDAFDRSRRYTHNRQSLILAGQAFGNREMHGEEPEDVRAMAYLGIIHGARGILWYTWHDGGNQGVVFHPKTRETTTAVIGEIRVFAPALFATGGRVEARSADGNVHALLCGDETTGRYLLLVNASDDAARTELRLGALKGASLEPLFGAPKAKVSGGVLRLDFAGRATAVYVVR